MEKHVLTGSWEVTMPPKIVPPPPEEERLQSVESAAPEAASPLPTQNRIFSYALWTVTLLAIGVILRYAKDVFVPIVLALLLAYALDPLVSMLARIRIHRYIGAAIVLLLFIGGSLAIIYAMRGQINNVLDSLPPAAQKIRETLQEHRGPAAKNGALGKVSQAANELEKAAREVSGTSAPAAVPVQPQEPLFSARQYVWIGSQAFLLFLSEMMVLIFLTYFILSAGDLYKRKLVRIVGSNLSEKRTTVEILNEIDTQIKRYVIVQFGVCASEGVAVGIALWLEGLEGPAVWGLIFGVLSSIPYFGPIIATAGISIAAFVQFGQLEKVGTISLIIIVIAMLDGYVVKPFAFGRAANINQIAMFVGLLFWTWIWGVAGMLLAVPIVVVMKTISDHIPELQPVSELLSE
jgi:predicted PurR-regulated permease PerM